MQFTWSFIEIFLLIIFPGLIARRLYFFGEFSKQFGSYSPLENTLILSIIPGVITFLLSLLVYTKYFLVFRDQAQVDIFFNILVGANLQSDIELNWQTLWTNVLNYFLPFFLIELVFSFVIGVISGRLVVLLNLDTTWKIFRYKNYWYYLFTARALKIPKYKISKTKTHEAEHRNVFLFSHIDVMIDTDTGPMLYTGILVDYFLDEDRTNELSKLVLSDAIKYKQTSATEKEEREIQGNLFTLDCSRMLNLNIRYVFKQFPRTSRISNFLKFTFYAIPAVSIILLPIFIFRIHIFNAAWFDNILAQNFIIRLVYWFLVLEILQFLNPLFYRNEKLRFKNFSEYLAQGIIILVTYIILYLLKLLF